MKISWHTDARRELQEFDERVQELLMKHIDRLEEAPLGENTSLLTKQGLEIYRLKIKDGELDHRVFFDIDGKQVIVLGVLHRDQAYTPSSLNEIKSRQ